MTWSGSRTSLWENTAEEEEEGGGNEEDKEQEENRFTVPREV